MAQNAKDKVKGNNQNSGKSGNSGSKAQGTNAITPGAKNKPGNQGNKVNNPLTGGSRTNSPAGKDKPGNQGSKVNNPLTGGRTNALPNNRNNPGKQGNNGNSKSNNVNDRIRKLKDKIAGRDTALTDQQNAFNTERENWQSSYDQLGSDFQSKWDEAQGDFQSRFDEQQQGFDESLQSLRDENEAYRQETEGLLGEYQSRMDQMGVDFENSWRQREETLRGELQMGDDTRVLGERDDSQFDARMDELASQIEQLGTQFEEKQQTGVDDAYKQQLEETLANYQRQFEELLKSRSESTASSTPAGTEAEGVGNTGNAGNTGIDDGQYQAFRDWQAQDAEYGLQTLRGGGRGRGSSPFSGSYSLASGTSSYQSGRAGRGSGSGSMISGSYGSRSSTGGDGSSLASGSGRPAADYYSRRFGR
jgi:hypothetical protein